MILLIDNYDSFSYNLVQLIGSVSPERIRIIRNDEVSEEEIGVWKPSHIILSPGPGRPEDAGICEDVVKRFMGDIPILGVCLGHQAICEALGARITYAKELMHGKQSMIKLDTESSIFAGLSGTEAAARYHSLAAEKASLPAELRVTGEAEDGEVMAVEHKDYALYGLQFHPESVLTPNGKKMMENFLNINQ
ncbi:aminodeoxychorismate/anthranilate synthase component II [Lacrimispora sp. NSJ-141]|uniref:Aminodeoxychorismate/anthranilate synthase component II n=1 Tax=Lientehia hominis TaxID=2897778 RepID=A0AAP2RHE2_9FIRM|nr:aminodeoxychorismate/anthranilate synthase component II [Lientehia hominis]MCD2491464.1 aminodeoxychorismate/anthranilate synthase component II [Lientehia hominis]